MRNDFFTTSNIKNVLILAPHTDDGEIGAGGFLNKLVKANKNVFYCAFSICEESVPPGFPKDILGIELLKATKVLGIPKENVFIKNYPVRKLNFHRQEILEDLIKLRSEIKFDLVLLPTNNDIHQDHETIYNEGVRAFKSTNILGYELIWNNLEYENQCYIELSEENIKAKVNSLKCYESQGFRSYVSEDFVHSLALVRGVQSGLKLAESFKIIRIYG